MNWATYGIIIIFAAFIILLILNPNLSCFGRRITSPLYPVLRKKKQSKRALKAQDYGFKLSDDGPSSGHRGLRKDEDEEPFLDQFKGKKYKTKDYGFKLSDSEDMQDKEKKEEGGENSQ